MTRCGWRNKVLRTAMTICMGGTAFQLSGCDSDVRDTLLSGLEATSQTLASSLISAFFLSVADDNGDVLTTT